MFKNVDFSSGLVTFDSLNHEQQICVQDKMAVALGVPTGNAMAVVCQLAPQSQHKLIAACAEDVLHGPQLRELFKAQLASESHVVKQAEAKAQKQAEAEAAAAKAQAEAEGK